VWTKSYLAQTPINSILILRKLLEEVKKACLISEVNLKPLPP